MEKKVYLKLDQFLIVLLNKKNKYKKQLIQNKIRSFLIKRI